MFLYLLWSSQWHSFVLKGKTLQYFLNPAEDEISVFEKCTNEVFADVIEQRRDVMASKLKYRGKIVYLALQFQLV